MRSRLIAVTVVIFASAMSASCRRDPRTYVASGDRYREQKNYAEAIIQYRNALVRDPKLGDARYKLAGTYETIGDLRNALAEYVRAADLMPDNVDAQLHAGKLLVTAGQFPEAKTRALAALAKDPKNVNGFIVLGNALAGLKDLDGAISQIEEAIDTAPQLTFSYANLGLLELARGNHSAAEAALKRAIDADPKSVPARLTLANFYWAAKQREDAERQLKAAYALDPKSEEVNRALAAFYVIGGQRSQAESYFKAYAAASSSVVPKVGLADFYLADGKTKEALGVLEPLSKEKNGLVPASLRLAMIEFKAGRPPKAYQILEDVLKKYPRSQETLEAKTRFLIAEGKLDEGIKLADSTIAANPAAVTSHYLRGLALVGKGSTDAAIKAFQRVLQLAPGSTPVQMQLASLYVIRGDGKTAAELLGPVLKAQPRSPMAHLSMGQAQLLAGNLDRAEAELVPLAQANPSSAEILTWLGRLYGAKGDLAKARQAFSRAFQIQPDSITALDGLVTLDVVEKNFGAARARLEAQLAKGQSSQALLFLAGNTYLTMGDTAKAEVLFKQVLQRDANNIDAYSRLGSIYVSQHRLDEARADFEEAARHQKVPVAARTLIGVILDMQGKPEDARKEYERALALDPQAAVAANNLASHYVETGDNLDVALKLAQTAKSKMPDDGRISDTLGWVYYKKGLIDSAITSLREGTQQNPSNPTIHYHLGLAYLKGGDRSKAKQSLTQALSLKHAFKDAEDAKRVLATLEG